MTTDDSGVMQKMKATGFGAVGANTLSAYATVTKESDWKSADSYYVIIYDDYKSNNNISYKDGTFTVNKAGYYQINAFIQINNTDNTNDGTIISLIKKNNTTITGSANEHWRNFLTATSYFAVGAKITTETSFSRRFFIVDGTQISITYLGEGNDLK